MQSFSTYSLHLFFTLLAPFDVTGPQRLCTYTFACARLPACRRGSRQLEPVKMIGVDWMVNPQFVDVTVQIDHWASSCWKGHSQMSKTCGRQCRMLVDAVICLCLRSVLVVRAACLLLRRYGAQPSHWIFGPGHCIARTLMDGATTSTNIDRFSIKY